jgi:glutathione-regulated potassium-efflux system ancillary protein KefC/glutathione-regulated potassium-efflux system protein KefB
MNETSLAQAFVYLLAALIAVPIAKRFGLGSVLGYLIAGVAIGPYGFGFLGNAGDVMHVAEFGVVIMLFLIGLELELDLLWSLRGAILGLGSAQVVVTSLAGAAIGTAFGLPWQSALAIGLILSASSTAIVMQSLRERGLGNSPAGRTAFSVLLMQDLMVIPMLALLPLLAAANAPRDAKETATVLSGLPDWAQGLAVLLAVALLVLLGRVFLRPAFRAIARTGLREMFTASALALVVGAALLMQTVGLSPALGAFMAGVVLADSEFRHELQADIEPFRGLLLGLFFLSVGANLDFALIAREPLLVIGLVFALISVKAAIIYMLCRVFRITRSDSVLTAFALAEGGEFAFVLASFAVRNHVLSETITDLLVAAVALSMATTPLLLFLAERIAGWLAPKALPREFETIETRAPDVLIAGFGRFGQATGRLLIASGYRTSVLDYSADQVELVRSFGHKTNYGDASRPELLEAAGAGEAKVLIIAIDDQEKALEMAETAREHFPHLKILARAWDRRHAYELLARKVDVIERETFEGGIRLGVQALRLLGMRANQAERAGGFFRRHDERLLMEMARHWGADNYREIMRSRQSMTDELMRRDLAAYEGGSPDEAWDTEALDAETGAPAPVRAR